MRYPHPLAALAVLTLAGCGNGERPADPVRPVVTITIAPGGAATRDVYSGEVRARVETDLAFRVGGKLAARLVDAGARVKAGQPLARLDSDDARLSAEAARAQLASAEAEFALAKAELDRAADLLARKFISQSAFDTRQNAFAAAKARVDQSRSQAAISANQQSYTTLVADGDGVILATSADAGQVVSAGQPVMRLAHDGAMEVVISAPESQVAEAARRPGRRDLAVGGPGVDPPRAGPRDRRRRRSGDADVRGPRHRASRAGHAAGGHDGQRDARAVTGRGGRRRAAGRARPPGRPGGRLGGGSEDVARFAKARQGRAVPRGGATILAGLSPGDIVVAAGVHKLRPDQPVRLVAGAPSPTAPAH